MAVDVRIDVSDDLGIELVGELDFESSPVFDAEVLPVAERFHADDIVIDVTDVGFVDLRGLDLLLQVSLAARPGGKITLLNSGPALRKLLEYTKAHEVFDLATLDLDADLEDEASSA
jgi:anti-anti-sigma factor